MKHLDFDATNGTSVINIIFHDSLLLFVPLTLGSLKNHVSFPNLLKFHNNESVPRYISTYCGGHLVCLFNIEMCFLQFRSILLNYFTNNVLPCTFSLQSFHKSYYLAIEIPDYAQLFSLWLLISTFFPFWFLGDNLKRLAL